MSTKKAQPKKAKVVREDKEYVLLPFQPLTFTLKTGRDNNLVIYDEEADENRAIKHCPNEKHIYVDQQSSKAVVKEIIFINGLFEAKATDVITQEFLDKHPSKGRLFSLIDVAAEAEEDIESDEIILDIKQAIRDKTKQEGGIEELRVIVSVLISDVSTASKMSVAELKRAAYEAVDTNYNRFVDDEGNVTIFDDSEVTRKAVAQHAFNSGIISVSSDSRKIQWSDNKATICLIPTGKNYLEYFTTFLETEDGMIVMREIDKRA